MVGGRGFKSFRFLSNNSVTKVRECWEKRQVKLVTEVIEEDVDTDIYIPDLSITQEL